MLPNAFIVYLEYDASENRGREQNHVKDFDIPSENEYDLKINTSLVSEEETYNLIKKLLRDGKKMG
jgi:cytidylate kinase